MALFRSWPHCTELRVRRRSGPIQKLAQPHFCAPPLCRDDRIANRVAGRKVCGHPMGSKNPFELCTDAFDRGARTLVARVRMQANTEHLPGFERGGEHKQLSLGIRPGPDSRAGKPGVADLAGIESAAVSRMALRPQPALNIPKPRRPDDGFVLQSDNREWNGAARVAPRYRRSDVRFGGALTL